jgi:hypothetical protein
MPLGRLTIARKNWPLLASELERRIAGQGELAPVQQELTPAVQRSADLAMQNYGARQERKVASVEREKEADFITIDRHSITSSYSRSIGCELVAHRVWEDLKISQFLSSLGFTPHECSLAEAVICGRLISPGSDLHTWRWIRNRSAIGEMSSPSMREVGRNAVYTISDKLYENKTLLEKHLLEQEKKLYPKRDYIYLFDLTNFHLEGQALGNDLAARGKSKQKRSDCQLVSLALLVDSDGFPVSSQVYKGNISEPQTLREILGKLNLLEKQGEFNFSKPTLIMDRGIATKDNIALLKNYEFPYVLIERGARNKDHLDAFNNYHDDKEFECIDRGNQQKVWVKSKKVSENCLEILCLSEGRKKKEQAMSNRWQERAAEDLIGLQTSIQKGNIKAYDKICKRIGRLQERYPSFEKHFSVNIELSEDGKKSIGLSFEKLAVVSTLEGENPLYGTYVIEANHVDKNATEIWHLYMTLTKIESAFRSLKSDLGTRPLYHQGAGRNKAHLFSSILAYHLLVNIEYRLSQKKDMRQWGTIRDILESHQRSTTIFIDKDKKIHEVRVTGTPESMHREIYRKLKIKVKIDRQIKSVARSL